MRNILIVDDSPFDRHLATSILKVSNDFHVISVADGRQALEALESTDFAVVVTDLNMPEMNGLELVREIRKRNSELPTIVMTAYGSEATAMRALQSGAFSYVPKFHLKSETLARNSGDGIHAPR